MQFGETAAAICLEEKSNILLRAKEYNVLSINNGKKRV